MVVTKENRMTHFIREPELLVVGAIILAAVILPQIIMVKVVVKLAVKLFN